MDCTWAFIENLKSSIWVNNYWLTGIDSLEQYGRCGFVYEEGETAQASGNLPYDHEQGNHPSITADERILHSPAYVLFHWVCI